MIRQGDAPQSVTLDLRYQLARLLGVVQGAARAEADKNLGDGLFWMRAKAAGITFGFWLGGSVAFYLAAWLLYATTRWVVQGFRRPA